MRRVTCEKGHSYDADKHTSCPYCGVNIDDFEIINKTQPIQPSAPAFIPNATQPMNQGIVRGGNIGHTQPLEENVMAVPTTNTSKTQALDSYVDEQKESNKTVAMYPDNSLGSALDPVVGWVVCISGPSKGCDFKILSGGNKLGRSSSNDIRIKEDEAVSRDLHAEITYDPVGKTFYLTPGTSRGITYLNSDIVLTPQVLKSYDKIKIGSSELLFIALCGDIFSWTE